MFAGIIAPLDDQRSSDKLVELSQLPQGLASIPYDDTAHWHQSHQTQFSTLVQQRYWNTANSKRAKGIVTHTPSQTQVLAWARIDNRTELYDQLPVDLQTLCGSDDGLILASYLHWGQSCGERLVGDFAFAIYDEGSRTLFCARDHTGVKPFYYYFDGKVFAFATSMAVLNQLPDLDLSLSEEWMARYLLSTSADWSLTSYQNISKLPPAHTLEYADNKFKLKRYFKFSLESNMILANDDEYVEAYREVLHQAVACRVRSDYPIGSESSGGLDSSTITALASRYVHRPGRNLHAFGFDESELTPECVIAVSQSSPVAMTHFVSKTGGSDGDITNKFWQTSGTPVEHNNGIGHHLFYEIAQKLGVRTLLSGFGGDEFVTNAAPTANVEFWRSRQWRLFLSRQRGRHLNKLPHALRWIYQYYRFNNHSVTSRALREGMQNKWEMRVVDNSMTSKYDLQNKLSNDNIYDGGKLTQNEFALFDRWSPMMTARYENCTLMAARYGIEYRWPLMDIRLLNLFLSIPAAQKLGPASMGRYLHRRAVVDVLPEFITWKTKDMEPFRLWKRIRLWIGRTPLAKAVKIYTQPNLKSLSKKNANLETHSEGVKQQFELHPAIDGMVDHARLQVARQVISNPDFSKEQKRVAQLHVRQLAKLNHWLHYLDKN